MSGDLLTRVEPPPDGVPAQVEFFIGGGPTCVTPPDGETVPYIRGIYGIEEIPRGLDLCFFGFDRDTPLRLTITPPAGPAVTRTLAPLQGDDDGFNYRYPRLPGHPVGRYAITARQGSLSAEAEFALVRATAPRLWIKKPPAPLPGAEVHLYLGGLPSGQPAILHLYGGDGMPYRTSFAIPVDGRGEAHAFLTIGRGDPSGCYGIANPEINEPGVMSDAVFCVD